MSLMMASRVVGLFFLCHGDLPRALPLLERAVGISQDTDSPGLVPFAAAALGAAYTLSGRIADAMPLLTRAMEQVNAMEMGGSQALCSLPLGDAHLLAGRLEEAHALAERALAFARAHQERGNQAYALRLLGDIAARREPPASDQADNLCHDLRLVPPDSGFHQCSTCVSKTLTGSFIMPLTKLLRTRVT
jgi:tetratricopeptide (TPR) repeat protein